MKILKSTRHAKITGDFSEALILYWLSKYGFECARVDHTGIDLIARNPHTSELIGVSVKSRCRTAGTEGDVIAIPADNFQKAISACKAFGCIPYFAIVVDAAGSIRGFILPMSRLLALCPTTGRGSYWRMSPRFLQQCVGDSEIKMFEFQTRTNSWWE